MQNTPSRQHKHHFDDGNPLAQKRILMATILTAVMMLLEVIGGWIFQSMALLADGWHMSSHVGTGFGLFCLSCCAALCL